MTTVTIPKELGKERDLIAIPKNIYGEFLAWRKQAKKTKIFMPTMLEKKALVRARKNFRSGKYTIL
ncbi:MAG: hypothetical protein Q7S52_00100 [bacterium]|nr:hypothetical protein [bacterium]